MMSKYQDQFDDSVVVCPYCNHQYQPEAEDFNEEERIQECMNCEKKFHHQDEISYTHSTRPDCEINGEAHVWELVESCNHDFCAVCDTIKPLTDEQQTKIRNDYAERKKL